jgi:hypothetical protein
MIGLPQPSSNAVAFRIEDRLANPAPCPMTRRSIAWEAEAGMKEEKKNCNELTGKGI